MYFCFKGRGSSADIRLTDISVSRSHSIISLKNKGITLTDN